MRLRDIRCPFCLEERAALRIDKKNRPYLTCTCGTRCFVPNARDAIRYLAVAATVLDGHVAQIATAPSYAAKIKALESEATAAFAELMNGRSVASSAPVANEGAAKRAG